MGILLGMTCAYEMTAVLGIEYDTIEYACDNETAVDKCFQYDDFHPAKLQHVDIIWAVQSLVQRTTWNINGFHVYGHQSLEKIASNQHARINHLVHNLANEFLTYCIQHKSEMTINEIPSDHWKINLHGKSLVKDLD